MHIWWARGFGRLKNTPKTRNALVHKYKRAFIDTVIYCLVVLGYGSMFNELDYSIPKTKYAPNKTCRPVHKCKIDLANDVHCWFFILAPKTRNAKTLILGGPTCILDEALASPSKSQSSLPPFACALACLHPDRRSWRLHVCPEQVHNSNACDTHARHKPSAQNGKVFYEW